jgi:predicted ABC-type ATPase
MANKSMPRLAHKHVREERCLGGRTAREDASARRSSREIERLGLRLTSCDGRKIGTNADRRRLQSLVIQMTNGTRIRRRVGMVMPHATDRRSRHDQQQERQRQCQTPLCAFQGLKQDG